VGPIGGLDIVYQRRFSCPCRISTAGRPFCSLVTIPTIPAARLMCGTNWIIKRNFRLNEILKSRTWSVANVSLLVERVALEQVFHRWLCKVEGTWNGWPSYSTASFCISGAVIRLFVDAVSERYMLGFGCSLRNKRERVIWVSTYKHQVLAKRQYDSSLIYLAMTSSDPPISIITFQGTVNPVALNTHAVKLCSCVRFVPMLLSDTV
jgi:hypothetical protein